MARKRISQREAIRLRRRVRALEAQINDANTALWCGGKPIAYSPIGPNNQGRELSFALEAARHLGAVVLARVDGQEIVYGALPVRSRGNILDAPATP